MRAGSLYQEEPLLRDGEGHYRTTEPWGWRGFISDGCPVSLPGGDRAAELWGQNCWGSDRLRLFMGRGCG